MILEGVSADDQHDVGRGRVFNGGCRGSLRIEFSGAFYHVLARGSRPEKLADVLKSIDEEK